MQVSACSSAIFSTPQYSTKMLCPWYSTCQTARSPDRNLFLSRRAVDECGLDPLSRAHCVDDAGEHVAHRVGVSIHTTPGSLCAYLIAPNGSKRMASLFMSMKPTMRPGHPLIQRVRGPRRRLCSPLTRNHECHASIAEALRAIMADGGIRLFCQSGSVVRLGRTIYSWGVLFSTN